ncbi:hypothetical protein [Leptolyngbya sp. 7M]|nr:hypothetical protein [Leptolyngbya sp. 7M]
MDLLDGRQAMRREVRQGIDLLSQPPRHFLWRSNRDEEPHA